MSFGNHFLFCAGAIAAALLLGGGTRPGFLSDVILQLACIPVAVSFVLQSGTIAADARVPRYAIAFCGALILIPALQLVPLPPAAWTALPGQHLVKSALEVAELPFTWRPISVSPTATWTSSLALLPPIAVFLGSLFLTSKERRTIVSLILCLGLVSAVLGLLQVAQGPESALRFYAVTNPTEAVGFFANRNHFSALIYSVLLFAGAWMTEALSHDANKEAGFGRITPQVILHAAIAFAVLIILISSQAMARSRAGIILSMVAIGLLFAIFASSSRRGAGMASTRVMISALLLTLILSSQFALYRILERFSNDPLQDARLKFVENTWQAMKAFLPFGSGLGTFVPVYAAFEKQEHAIPGIYANHAHNDVAELGLEAGIFGLALAALFTAWLVRAGISLWIAAGPQNEAAALDGRLKQAAAFVMALLLAHSLVDYPLRTGALSVLFAFCCALQFPAVARGIDQSTEGASEPKRKVYSRKPAQQTAPTPRLVRSSAPWDETVEWPDAWKGNASNDSAKRKPSDD